MIRPRLRRPTAKELLGSVLIAFGTIFLPKARPDDHWSAHPGVELTTELAADEAGADPKRRQRRIPMTA